MNRWSSLLATCSWLVPMAVSVPTPAMAGRMLEMLASPVDEDCRDFSVGALSHDGRHLLMTQDCFSADGGYSGRRGTLWRDFRDASQPAHRVWTPGHFSDLSADGRSAVGEAFQDPSGWETQAMVLRDSGEAFGIGYLPGSEPWRWSAAYAMSDTGSTIVGAVKDASGRTVPALWTAATGWTELHTSWSSPCEEDCEAPTGYASAVSGDGSVVIGRFDDRRFRWDAMHGMRPLFGEEIDEAFSLLDATDISGDGSSIVGTGILDGVWQPFVWSETTGLIGLDLPASVLGWDRAPKSVSRDGSVVVGGASSGYPFATFSPEDAAFIWTRETGLTDLRTALEDLGIDTAEWLALDSAWAVSGDGSTIVGSGYHRSDGVGPSTFHASLRTAPPYGVGLCELGRVGCHAVQILARSGQTVRIRDDLSSSALSRIGSLTHAIVNASGGVAFGARVVGFDDDLPSPPGYGSATVFAPDGSGRSQICPANPFHISGLIGSRGWLPTGDPREFALLDDGDVYFRSRVTIDEPGDFVSRQLDGIWRCHAGSNEVEIVALAGDEAPAGSGDQIDQIFEKFQVDGLGRVSFRGSLANPDDPTPSWDPSIFGPGMDGRPEVLLRTGTIPPGVAARPFGGAYFHTMSETGMLAFVGVLGEYGAHGPDQQDGLWATAPSGELALILRTGDPAPGSSGSRTFGSLLGSDYTPAVNARGELAIAVMLEGAGSLESTVWSWSPESGLTQIASETDVLPGLIPGRSVLGFDDPLINDRGDVLLSVILDHDPIHHHGYWLRTAEGGLVPLLQTGQAAPGLPDGVALGESTWDEVPAFDELDLAYTALTESGHALLEFHLVGTGIDETNDRALYLVDPAGDATLVLRRGDAIAVAHEDVRTIADFGIGYGYADGFGRSPVNDRGDVVTVLDFVDGTQAVAKISVPETRTGAMLMIGSLGLIGLRRFRRTRPPPISRGAAAAESAAIAPHRPFTV